MLILSNTVESPSAAAPDITAPPAEIKAKRSNSLVFLLAGVALFFLFRGQ